MSYHEISFGFWQHIDPRFGTNWCHEHHAKERGRHSMMETLKCKKKNAFAGMKVILKFNYLDKIYYNQVR